MMANCHTPFSIESFAKAYTNDGFVDTVVPRDDEDIKQTVLDFKRQKMLLLQVLMESNCMRPMGIYCTNFLMGIPTIDLILMVDQ
jgi:hypothetical protein